RGQTGIVVGGGGRIGPCQGVGDHVDREAGTGRAEGGGELAGKRGQGALVAPRYTLEVEVDTGEVQAPHLAHHGGDQGGAGACAVEQQVGPTGAGVVVLEHGPHLPAGRCGRGQGERGRSALEAAVRLHLPAGGAED